MRSPVLLLTIACGVPTAADFSGGEVGQVQVSPPGDSVAPSNPAAPAMDAGIAAAPPDAGSASDIADAGTSTAMGPNLAKELWEAHAEATAVIAELETANDDSFAHWAVVWVQVASRAANHITTAGTVTEHADGTFSYSASPGTQLVVVRSSGATFSFAVTALTGDITQPSFPLNTDSISFTWNWSECDLTATYAGTVHDYRGWYNDLSGNRVDVAVHQDDDKELITTSASVDDYADLKLSGTVGVNGYSVTFTEERVFGDCMGAGCFIDPGLDISWSETLTKNGSTWSIPDGYQDTVWDSATSAEKKFIFTGTIKQGSTQVGLLGTRVTAQLSNGKVLLPFVEVGSDEFDLPGEAVFP
jgi:hypothetical protein